MADETQGVQNKGILLVAILLAVVVLVVYNFHIASVKSSQAGELRRVAQYKRAIRSGKIVNESDIIGVNVPVLDPKSLGNVVLYSERDSIIGKTLIQDVNAGQYVAWGHTNKGQGTSYANVISRGKVAIAIEIESATSPGPMLKSFGRVNLVGRFSLGGKPERAYSIMENVRVLSVGGSSPDVGDPSPGRAPRSSTTYRRIMIELTSEQHRRLLDVLAHINGPVVIEVLNHNTVPAEAGGIVDEALVQAARATGGSGRRSGR